MKATITSLLLLSAATAVQAADPPRFKFEKGQTLTYTIVQATKAVETIIDEKTSKPVEQQHVTRHTVVRRWKVAQVDASGVATLEMSLVSMRWEEKLPDGETTVFDSTRPDDLNKSELAKLIGPVVAVLRIDPTGKVIEVKESKFGPKSRFESDLPFKVLLPDAAVKAGQSWERAFTIKLDPPQGTGETYNAVQKYTAKEPANGYTTFGLSTVVKDMPNQAGDQIPLLPMLLEGDVYFNAETGQYQAARLKLKKELANHQGEGTRYVLESTYAEDLKVEK